MVPGRVNNSGFVTNELLNWICLCALVFVALIPALAALRDALEAEARPTAWQVVIAVAWGLARGVIPMVVVFVAISYGVVRLLTFRPGTRVRITGGPWAGAAGVVADDHDPSSPGPVTVVLNMDGAERRERLSPYNVRKAWLPRWL